MAQCSTQVLLITNDLVFQAELGLENRHSYASIVMGITEEERLVSSTYARVQ